MQYGLRSSSFHAWYLLYDCGPVRGRGFCQVQMCPAQEIEEHKQFVQKETGHYYALLAKQIFLT